MLCSDASRKHLRAIGAFATGLAALLAPQAALAQTFPQDPQWVPLTCNGQVATDPPGDAQPQAIDAVGDDADPAAYVFMDSTWLYLRLRTDATVLENATTFEPYAWACLLRTPGTPGSYLVWNGVDGLANPEDVELQENTHPQPADPIQQPAGKVVATYPITTSARQAAAPSQLGGNPNFFVDWAVALSDLANVGITPSTPVSFICGTSKTERILDGDIIGDGQACRGVLDAVECLGNSCAVCTTETACGPSCAECGGATPVCNPAFGCFAACTSDVQCGGSTPVCDTGRGLCVGCTSNASCPSGTTCNTATGFCVGCTSDASCPGGTFCDTASGTCAPCAGAASCAGAGSGSGGGNVLAEGKIEGGSCACDLIGGDTPKGGLAALALGIAAALRARARRGDWRNPPARR